MWIKYLHVATVILSFAGFFLRGILMLRGSPIYWSRSPLAPPGPTRSAAGRTDVSPVHEGPAAALRAREERRKKGLYLFARVAPHVNDTLLLAAGIALALRIQQYPLVHGWLTAKLVGLIVYIGLGLVALRFGRTRRVRLIAWAAALVVYLYIVGVAMTRDATLGLAQLT